MQQTALARQDSALMIRSETASAIEKDASAHKVFPQYHKGQDEALKILAEHVGEAELTEAEEAKLRRKIDWRILTLVMVTYALQSMDKGALGVAAIFGIVQDLELFQVVSTNPTVLDTGRYSWVSSIFFCGFIAGAFPLGYIAQKLPVGKVCAVYCFIWGVVVMLTPACKNYEGILAQRFFLGFIESGVSPAFLLVISSWYKQNEQALRISFFYASTGIATVPFYFIWLGIAKAVPHAPGTVPNAWREIYYFCGGITIAWSAVIYFFLPDSAVTARFLNERERYVAVERLREGQTGVRNRVFKIKQALTIFIDPKCYLVWFMTFAICTPVGISTNFSALVIRDVVGAGTYRALALSTPGAVVLATFAIGGGYLAMKVRNTRTFVYAFSTCVSMMSAALLWKLPLSNKSGLLAAVMLLNSFGGGYSQTLGFTGSNFAGHSRKTAVSAMTFIFYCLGNLAGPQFFLKREAPRYESGFKATTICLCLGIGFSLIHCALCWRENHKRSKLPRKEIDEAFLDLTDRENTAFRYQL